jgi:Pvc16 N-terminal domain/Carboxypeptidase regulatory-like domain
VIDQLDTVLRGLLVTATGLPSGDHVRFDPPDDDWRTYVNGTLKSLALNVYLVEVRENRRLRSADRDVDLQGMRVMGRAAPSRIDCQYLVSAWHPSTGALTPASEPTVLEHRLLTAAAAGLLREPAINPSRVFPGGDPRLAAIDPEIRDSELPLTVLPPEGFPKLAEFWGAMGATRLWRPALELTVTLPVAHHAKLDGTIVTTLATTFREERRVDIGGTVLAAAGTPALGAWIGLESGAGELLQLAISDGSGRFTFSGLDFGTYRLRARVAGRPEAARTVDVPSVDGTYDVHLT